MRSLTIVLAAGVLVGLALLQFASSVFSARAAQPGAWMRAVPPAVAPALETRAGDLALPAALRILLARRALAEHRLTAAEFWTSGLAPSSDRAALFGRLAAARGDHAAAERDFVSAGDFDGIESEIVLIEKTDIDRAIVLQAQLVEQLTQEVMQPDAQGEAFWHLGGLYATRSYRDGRAASAADSRRAVQAFEAALERAPLSGRYLVTTAFQYLNAPDPRNPQPTPADFARAQVLFERAILLDPKSVDAVVGLGELVLRHGDRATANAYLARALSIDPAAPSARRLADKLAH